MTALRDSFSGPRMERKTAERGCRWLPRLALELSEHVFESGQDRAASRDRSGAQVEFACTSKLVPTDKVKGTMFLAHRGTSIIAVPHDPKQSRLFEGVDGKSLAAGERDPKKKSDVM